MTRQYFTYTGPSIKYKPTGKRYVVNKNNKSKFLAHFKSAYAANPTNPNYQYKLPKNLRFSIQEQSFKKSIKKKTKKAFAKVKRALHKKYIKPIKTTDFTGEDKLYNKKKFVFKFNPNLTLKQQLAKRLEQIKNKNPDTMFNIVINQGGIDVVWTTTKTDNASTAEVNNVINDAANRYLQYINQYEGNIESAEYIADKQLRDQTTQPTTIAIQRWTPKPNTNNQLIGSGTTNINHIEGEGYFHLNIPNHKNCFYSSLAILNSTCSKRSKKEDFDKLFETLKKGWKVLKKFIQEKGCGLKEKFKKIMKKEYDISINDSYSDREDIISHVNYNANGKWGTKEKGWGKKIVVLDVKYNILETINPEKPDNMNENKFNQYIDNLPTYYLMLYKNHYSALIPKEKIEAFGHNINDWNEELKNSLERENVDMDKLIRKNTYQQIPNNQNMLNNITERLRHRNKIAKAWNKENPKKIPKPVFDYKTTNKMIRDEYKNKMKELKEEPYRYELFNKEYDYKIATYDIEATDNYIEGEFQPLFNVEEDNELDIEKNRNKMPFQSYMIGLSWFEYPLIEVPDETNTFITYDERNIDRKNMRYVGQREYKYIAFEGMDCIKQFFDYLTKNADKFNDYTFWAHNGSSFDVPILLRENLCINDNWRITKNVELNGGYIGLTICDGNNTINFKDSLRHLMGSLDSLCKEIDTPNKKKKELFQPEEINLQNWNSDKYLPNLREYLKYDCWSLLDLVDIYSHTLYFSYVPNLEEYEKIENVKLEFGNPTCSVCGHECRGAVSNSENHKGRWFWACGGECRFGNKPRWIQWATNEESDEFDKLSVKKITNRVCRINMTDCFTSSSFAKKLLYKHYLPHGVGDRFKISHLCKEKEQKIRKGYYGGRTEAFMIGSSENMGIDKLYYFDETSKYPAEMVKHKIPYGLPEYVIPTEKDNESWNSVFRFVKKNFGFYKVKIRSTEFSKKYKPLIGYKDPNTGRLQFQYFNDWFEIEGLFSEEILMGLKHNLYEFQLIECIKFKADYILRNISKGLFENKARAKKAGNAVEAKSNKITVNSVYGMFGFNCTARDGITILDKDDIGAYKKLTTPDENGDAHFTKVAVQGNYRFIRSKRDVEINDVNVSIASSITSYARCSLWEYLFMTELNGGKVLMVDTDSCIGTLDFMKTEHKEPIEITMNSGWCKDQTFTFNTDMVKRFCWDHKGEALGAWKNECEEDLEDEFAKQWCKREKLDKKQLKPEEKKRMKQYVKDCMGYQRRFNNMSEGDSFYFDKLIMVGCKAYYLNKKLFNGDNEYMETKKLKGLRQGKESDETKFIYESEEEMKAKKNGKPLGQIHYERLITNDEIFQNQLQFKNPLANHLDENNPFSISIKTNGKKFKQVYTKGKQIVHEKKGIEIQPWNWPEDYTEIDGKMVVDYREPSKECNIDTLIAQN